MFAGPEKYHDSLALMIVPVSQQKCSLLFDHSALLVLKNNRHYSTFTLLKLFTVASRNGWYLNLPTIVLKRPLACSICQIVHNQYRYLSRFSGHLL